MPMFTKLLSLPQSLKPLVALSLLTKSNVFLPLTIQFLNSNNGFSTMNAMISQRLLDTNETPPTFNIAFFLLLYINKGKKLQKRTFCPSLSQENLIYRRFLIVLNVHFQGSFFEHNNLLICWNYLIYIINHFSTFVAYM